MARSWSQTHGQAAVRQREAHVVELHRRRVERIAASVGNARGAGTAGDAASADEQQATAELAAEFDASGDSFADPSYSCADGGPAPADAGAPWPDCSCSFNLFYAKIL